MFLRKEILTTILFTVLTSGFVTTFILRQALADNVSTPTRLYTFASGGTIKSAEINGEYNNIITALANIGTANIIASGVNTDELASACVTEAKLASAVTQKLEQTGVMKDYLGTTAPAGYVLASGRTIGSAASGATERANADTQDLYTLLWTSMADAQAPVSGGRGASAAADFNANKTLTLPDLRGRVSAGDDNLGGSTASRISVAGGSFDGTILGNSGGLQNHTLTTAQLPAHNHGVTDPGHNHTHTDPGHLHGVNDPGHVHTHERAYLLGTADGSAGGASLFQNTRETVNTGSTATGVTIQSNTTGITNNSATTGISTNNAGSGSAHPIVQPTYVVTRIIKL